MNYDTILSDLEELLDYLRQREVPLAENLLVRLIRQLSEENREATAMEALEEALDSDYD